MNAQKFFVPRREAVPPNVTAPPRIQATSLPPLPGPSQVDLGPPSVPALPSSQPPPCHLALELLDRFHAKIQGLPKTIPEASNDHAIAAFSFDPVGCVGDGEDAWEKWDGPLNGLLQHDAEKLRDLVVRGERGLIGLCKFLHYLVTVHGVQGTLIEMKVGRLLQAIEEVYV